VRPTSSTRSPARAAASRSEAYICRRLLSGADSASATNAADSARTASGAARCEVRSPSSRSTWSVTESGLSRDRYWNGPGAAPTTRDASRNRAAPVIIRASPSTPSRSPWSLTKRAANAS